MPEPFGIFLVILFLALSALSRAEDARPPSFIVHTAEGANLSGPLVKLQEEGSLRLEGEHPAVVAGREVVAIRREGQALPDYPHENAVILTNGDRVPFDPKFPFHLEEGQVQFHLAGGLQGLKGTEVKVARAYVAVLWLTKPRRLADPDLILSQLLKGQRANDVLLLRDGDRVEGTITGIDRKQGCRMETGQRKLAVAWSQVAAVAFNTELRARLKQRGPYSHVVLAGGGRLGFVSLHLEPGGKHLQGKALFGARLSIPLNQVAALQRRQGQVVYLSDLEAKSYQHTSFFQIRWPLVRDAAVTGRPLRLAGNTYDKGLGTHSRAQIRFALDGNYRWFETLVGLDERTGRKGRVRLQVLVDGKEQNLGLDRELTGADAPLTLRIDVRKARELTLVVDFGSLGDVQAHVDWADARLIR